MISARAAGASRSWLRAAGLRSLGVQSRAASGAAARKLYEYRVYSLQPEHFPAFMKLTNESMHMRTAHSKLLGYFLSEIGGVNEVVHLWEYDSLPARQQVREALVKDSAWMEGYMAKMRPMLQRQENSLMVATSGTVLDQSSSGGVYEVHLGSPDALWTSVREQHAAKVGDFRVIGGAHLGKEVSVWNYASLQKVNDTCDALAGAISEGQSVTLDGYTKVAFPAPFSPLQ